MRTGNNLQLAKASTWSPPIEGGSEVCLTSLLGPTPWYGAPRLLAGSGRNILAAPASRIASMTPWVLSKHHHCDRARAQGEPPCETNSISLRPQSRRRCWGIVDVQQVEPRQTFTTHLEQSCNPPVSKIGQPEPRPISLPNGLVGADRNHRQPSFPTSVSRTPLKGRARRWRGPWARTATAPRAPRRGGALKEGTRMLQRGAPGHSCDSSPHRPRHPHPSYTSRPAVPPPH